MAQTIDTRGSKHILFQTSDGLLPSVTLADFEDEKCKRIHP